MLSLNELETKITELESALAKQDQYVKDQQQAAKVQAIVIQRQIDATRTASSGSTDVIYQGKIDQNTARIGAVVVAMKGSIAPESV